MSYEMTGRVTVIFDTVQRTDTFKTREFVVEKTDDINGRVLTNYIRFQAVQDKTALLDKVKKGDEVKVHFNLRGTKWVKDGKENFITNLDAWRVEQFVPSTSGGDDNYAADMQTPEPPIDDLPF